MRGAGALHSEMPGFSFPGRPGGEHDEPLLDMIFDRRPLPPGASAEMRDLALMLGALAGPAEPGELAGEAAARAAFARLASPARISSAASGRDRRPLAPRPARSPARPAAARLTGGDGAGGAAPTDDRALPGHCLPNGGHAKSPRRAGHMRRLSDRVQPFDPFDPVGYRAGVTPSATAPA